MRRARWRSGRGSGGRRAVRRTSDRPTRAGPGGGRAGRRRGPASCSRPGASAAFARHRARPAPVALAASSTRLTAASPRRRASPAATPSPLAATARSYSRASSSIAAGNRSASSPAATRSAPTHSAARTSAEPEQRVTGWRATRIVLVMRRLSSRRSRRLRPERPVRAGAGWQGTARRPPTAALDTSRPAAPPPPPRRSPPRASLRPATRTVPVIRGFDGPSPRSTAAIAGAAAVAGQDARVCTATATPGPRSRSSPRCSAASRFVALDQVAHVNRHRRDGHRPGQRWPRARPAR